MWAAVDGVCYLAFLFLCSSNSLNLGNNEAQYYTRNRRQNARCELFHDSRNGRLIIEARKVRLLATFVPESMSFLVGKPWQPWLYIGSSEE